MRAVPRQEILHAVAAGHGDMERILRRLCGQCLSADEHRRERNGRIRDVQEREAFEHGDASLSSVWITRAWLSQHDLRGEEVIVRPLLLPPRHSELSLQFPWPEASREIRMYLDKDNGFQLQCLYEVIPTTSL
jgi:hypothetical protein